MAENKDGQEKTEPASAKRLSEARLRGQVSKSMDVTTAAMLLFGMLAIYFFGGSMITKIEILMRDTFTNLTKVTTTVESITGVYKDTLLFIAIVALPILGSIFAITIIAEVAQVGFTFASKKFSEGSNILSNFNPISGLKKIFFSSRSAFELLKSLLKILILGLIVYQVIDSRTDDTIALMDKPFTEIATFMASLSLEMVLKVSGVYIIIALMDFLYQKHRFREDMKMTLQEVKEETKQTEGDPKIKSRLRSLMRQRVRRLMLKNVKTADVVITNPTHFAVALSYKHGSMTAPRVVAKGLDFLALQIRSIAQEANVPIVEDPPLARALYFTVNIDQDIPENLFKAVAQVLAYVYFLKQK